jgi:hypothetical protein
MRSGILVGVLVLAGACRFDGGGITSDDDGRIDGGGDDDIAAIDGSPGAPDAMPDVELDAAPLPAPGTLTAPPTAGAVTIDGSNAEFVAAGAVPITYAIQNGQLYETSTASYAPSSTVTLSAIHDDDAIYFFARVVDSVYAVDSVAVWDDDGIMLFLDVLGDAAGPYSFDDHGLVVRADGEWSDYGPVGTSADLTAATVHPAGSYSIEVSVAKSSLSATVGGSMGFDLGLTDDDGWSDSAYDASSLWFMSARPECATCCTDQTANQPFCDTTMFGTLILE